MNTMARNRQVTADHNTPAVTHILARFVATHPSQGWSDEVDLEAHRTFMNWLGCAVGACAHEVADVTLAAVRVLQPSAQASVLGRVNQVDMVSAALLNGITSHSFDFDDTHLKTISHPAGLVASGLLALAEHQQYTGREVIDAQQTAMALGMAVSQPIGVREQFGTMTKPFHPGAAAGVG
jgi:2-methylcitrate dehydratase PrpD